MAGSTSPREMQNEVLRALVPRGRGHQFVCYADSCSGVPGAQHETTFASVNQVVARLRPRPEFICFPGDEIAGLTPDPGALRAQWRHWLERETAWIDRVSIPVYHTTGNHTTYDAQSEAVFREMLPHLPRNGPQDQEGLSYFVRNGDLLLVFVNTASASLGGEGRVETDWLERTLAAHHDVAYKLVLGHHPVFSVNGFAGEFQRDIERENGRSFWQVLVRHRVLAYICSHILAFDVQVHEGILQILTAGAGTAARMPAEQEYLHCVQAAIDSEGLRYQVLDTSGTLREWLRWPIHLPHPERWTRLVPGSNGAPYAAGAQTDPHCARIIAWEFSGAAASSAEGTAQTWLAAHDGRDMPQLWIGLIGPEQRLAVSLSPSPGRSPHLWHGPLLAPGAAFSLQLALHTGMGPGGLLWRRDENTAWSSLTAASPWGPERIRWAGTWTIGHDQRGPKDRSFRGTRLQVRTHMQVLDFDGPQA